MKQEDDERTSTAQLKSTDLLRRIIVPVGGQGVGHTAVRVPPLSSVSVGRLHLLGLVSTKEEAVQLVVCGVRRPARLEEPEQRFAYTGQHGPQRGAGVSGSCSAAGFVR